MAIRIHIPSALIGGLIIGLLLGTVSMQQTVSASSVQPLPAHGGCAISILGIPTPQQMIVIKEGAPFLVPTGKLLVLTGLGSTTNSITVSLFVDGAKEMEAVANLALANSTTIRELPTGFVVHSGSTVEVITGAPFGRAWGYVVDA